MDIFVSYARATEEIAERLAQALRGLGYGVWRDDQLPAHRPYGTVIEEHLDAAKAVIVVWSAEALRSEWVRSEADRARQQGKLVQLAVEPVRLPMPFDQIQCADLIDWREDRQSPGWGKVLASLRQLVGPQTRETVASQGSDPQPARLATNLPFAPIALVGREDDVQALETMIAAAPLVTVVGGGGVGKTSLSLEAVRSRIEAHEDGVWLTELAGVTDPARVAEIVAKAMHIELPVHQDAREALVDRLRRRRCLLLLDNCEHLIEAVAALAQDILAQAPEVKLVLTSQEPLGVAGEQVYRLAPLSRRDATELFVQRARASDPAFAPDPQERSAISAICRRLDGVPLAIEMAAVRAPALGCTAILERLDDRFRVLTGGRRTALPRHRTLLAALDWSHNLLSPRDATVFRRLGVFVGSFSLKAVAAIAADTEFDHGDVTEALASLVSKSLVTIRSRGERPRYQLAETPRAYALDRLAEAGELGELRLRHAQWYAEFAQPIWSDFISQISDETLLARYLPEFENVHSALDWAFGAEGDPELGARILAATACLWDDRSLKQRLDVAIPRLGDGTSPAVRAKLLAARAHVTMRLSPPAALKIVDEAVAAVRDGVGDPVALCDVLASKTAALWLTGRFAEARTVADEMAGLIAERPPSRIRTLALALNASLQVVEAGPNAGAPLFDQAIEELRGFGADGLANFWRWTSLRLIPTPDPDEDIHNFRALLARIRPGEMYAEPITLAVAKELAAKLARRGAPADLAEALGLAQVFFKAGALTLDPAFLMTMAEVAAKSGRAETGALIQGYVAGRHQAPADPRLAAAIEHEAQVLQALLAEALGERRRAELAAHGARLGEALVVRLAAGEAEGLSGIEPDLQLA